MRYGSTCTPRALSKLNVSRLQPGFGGQRLGTVQEDVQHLPS